MDVGDAVSSAAAFPLPFRVLFLIGLGILGWATNLHGFHLLGIDAPSTLHLQAGRVFLPITSPLPRTLPSAQMAYMPVYRLFAGYTAWCLAGWGFFRLATSSSTVAVDVFKYVPAICFLGVLTVLICPFDVCQKREREAFLQSVSRCLFSSMDAPIYLADVVFADVFTSFAKVIGDVWLSLHMLLPGGSLLSLPSLNGLPEWILPSLMSLPYLVRFRQCLIEHQYPSNTSKRHLFNALKYATSFPVIFLSAAQRIVVSELAEQKGRSVVQQPWHGEHPLFRLWLSAATVNSLYSFWWDLTNDWGLDLLNTRFASRANHVRSLVHPSLHSNNFSVTSSRQVIGGEMNHRHGYLSGLRSVLLYPLPIYPLVMFFNLVLRMTWSVKLSSHLHSHSEGSTLIFWLEVAEVLRRWIWFFVRVEWEVVKSAQHKFHTTAREEIGFMPLMQIDPMDNQLLE